MEQISRGWLEIPIVAYLRLGRATARRAELTVALDIQLVNFHREFRLYKVRSGQILTSNMKHYSRPEGTRHVEEAVPLKDGIRMMDASFI